MKHGCEILRWILPHVPGGLGKPLPVATCQELWEVLPERCHHTMGALRSPKATPASAGLSVSRGTRDFTSYTVTSSVYFQTAHGAQASMLLWRNRHCACGDARTAPQSLEVLSTRTMKSRSAWVLYWSRTGEVPGALGPGSSAHLLSRMCRC